MYIYNYLCIYNYVILCIYIFNYVGMNLCIHIRMIMACFDIMDGVALQPKNSQIKPIPCSTETEIA